MFHFRLRSAAKEDTGRGSHVRIGFNFWRVRGQAMDACPERNKVSQQAGVQAQQEIQTVHRN